MQKQLRQTAIIKLIVTKPIATQEELTGLLEKKGYSVTQSSISRDLLELGIIKLNGNYALPQKSQNAISLGLLGMEKAGENLIVVKCEAGLASAVAVRIDNAEIEEIIGTIAGDDTIFIAVKDYKSQISTMKIIWEMFEK